MIHRGSLIELGITRVLTSGQKATAIDGAAMIAELVKQAGSRISILACGGIDETTAAEVVAATGANEFHFTAFEDVSSNMEFRNESVAMGADKCSVGIHPPHHDRPTRA